MFPANMPIPYPSIVRPPDVLASYKEAQMRDTMSLKVRALCARPWKAVVLSFGGVRGCSGSDEHCVAPLPVTLCPHNDTRKDFGYVSIALARRCGVSASQACEYAGLLGRAVEGEGESAAEGGGSCSVRFAFAPPLLPSTHALSTTMPPHNNETS
ncbi:hypothetical protein P280DRAFT_143445 [Massarina eburnea CBS 473.64]|uniref:Uncharacterized protein n=1 Tax=Massarina eburnea CBS 473.64 TaxID=1395130 RepID=A0A6A6RNW2_9PLEO|nr:hypothetical protein P280DRAFT_143445 [Massarina eburnea CBS 473.64]